MPIDFYAIVQSTKTGKVMRTSDPQDYKSAVSTQRDWIEQDRLSEMRYTPRMYVVVPAKELRRIKQSGYLKSKILRERSS